MQARDLKIKAERKAKERLLAGLPHRWIEEAQFKIGDPGSNYISSFFAFFNPTDTELLNFSVLLRRTGALHIKNIHVRTDQGPQAYAPRLFGNLLDWAQASRGVTEITGSTIDEGSCFFAHVGMRTDAPKKIRTYARAKIKSVRALLPEPVVEQVEAIFTHPKENWLWDLVDLDYAVPNPKENGKLRRLGAIATYGSSYYGHSRLRKDKKGHPRDDAAIERAREYIAHRLARVAACTS